MKGILSHVATAITAGAIGVAIGAVLMEEACCDNECNCLSRNKKRDSDEEKGFSEIDTDNMFEDEDTTFDDPEESTDSDVE